MNTLAQIIDELIMDATDADVYGVPDRNVLECRALREAKKRGITVTEQDVHIAVESSSD